MSEPTTSQQWWIYRGTGVPHDGIKKLPPPPPWRAFQGTALPPRTLKVEQREETYRPTPDVVELVNAALFLRRPLLVTGRPGIGKTSLARAVAHELRLGPLLKWPINTRSTLVEGLYRYDAIARLQDASLRHHEGSPQNQGVPPIGQYLRLGPLGTALLPTDRPRVLLIDEIDKGDIDLPNDLLHVFEEGEFEIPELTRQSQQEKVSRVRPADGDDEVPIENGRVVCREFPLVIMTSNGEREFPPAFLRRCLRLDMKLPEDEALRRKRLKEIVENHLKAEGVARAEPLISQFLSREGRRDELATDQLLNAVYLATRGVDMSREQLLDSVLRSLNNPDGA
jgi:MoxR-like ATPase